MARSDLEPETNAWDVVVDSSSAHAKRGGALTGPNPKYHSKLGTKYHVIVDAGGLPLAAVASAANVNDTRLRETAMLLGEQRRVELNAMASNQFIEFLERRLMDCGARKVVPDAVTLEKAWRRGIIRRRLVEEVELLRAEAERDAEAADVPADLAEQVRKRLEEHPRQSWDEAVDKVPGSGDGAGP